MTPVTKPRGLKAGAFRDCVFEVSSEGLGTLPPLRRISGRTFTERICHAKARTEGGRSQGTGIPVGLGHVVAEFIAEAECGPFHLRKLPGTRIRCPGRLRRIP
jgi:hypothetical protein